MATHRPTPFKIKSSWTPPPSENLTLTNFFTRTEEDLICVKTSGRKTYSNLTLQEKSALNNHKNNQSIVMKPCDKGGGICIMNTRTTLREEIFAGRKFGGFDKNPSN